MRTPAVIESAAPSHPIALTLAGFVDYTRRCGGLGADLAAELVFEFDATSKTLTVYGGQRAAALATHARIQSLLVCVHDYWYQGGSEDVPVVELVLPESSRLH